MQDTQQQVESTAKLNTSNSTGQICQTLSSQLNTNHQQKKSIGSIPPLPPSTMASLTPRNKSKDKSHHLKSFMNNANTNSAANLNVKDTNSNLKSRILGKFNRKAHSKDLESLSHVDASAPALKSITRSPSPSLSSFQAFGSSSFSGPSQHRSNGQAWVMQMNKLFKIHFLHWQC